MKVKVGDYVYCNQDINEFKMNKKYFIYEIGKYKNAGQILWFDVMYNTGKHCVRFIENDFNLYFNSIKLERKRKLEKLNEL